ncbi:uncharacterized protein P174DRAFT_515349 [Aspergillus novofumigatus IBT 16806]|uniref:Uncharacterized protein n=1 Tax=Aspergillus novofumigatus (strain IBT 16806) TaxID=1392255 RepID=A0A2I1BXU8_ASPN1|nr:uncharacterized protein P174DRAFT_515349 [Aspergillus novofumigatus IBT 16806]PKX90198.1 hypothetical protein P174DRAFT_515349 [Aspergillus novofumigatus IBT 16806]
MADLRYRKEDRIYMIWRNYPCKISRFLDAHGIPNVLWGELVMNMFLIPIVADGIYFVIPNEHIDKAHDLLPKSPHGIPYAHFNIVDHGPKCYYKPKLYGPIPKSELLWGAPEIPLSPPTPNDPDYWTINDERLPEVPRGFQLGHMVEADYPDYLLIDMQVVLKKHRLFTLSDLPPRTRSWFKILTENLRERTHGDADDRFGEEMRKSGEVPEKSPWPSEHRMPPGWREELKQWEEEEEERRKKKKEEEEQTRKNEEEVKEEQNA